MLAEEFKVRCQVARMDSESKTCVAARMVLVDGLSVTKAALSVPVCPSVVSRGVKRLRAVVVAEVVCPACGHRFSQSAAVSGGYDSADCAD